jgi:hypothetical protein
MVGFDLQEHQIRLQRQRALVGVGWKLEIKSTNFPVFQLFLFQHHQRQIVIRLLLANMPGDIGNHRPLSPQRAQRNAESEIIMQMIFLSSANLCALW